MEGAEFMTIAAFSQHRPGGAVCRPERWRRVAVGLFCLIPLFFSGCLGGHFGGLKHSSEVAQAFETFQVYEGCRYYYLNQENNPYAVVALHNRYTLTGKMWIEFDPRSEKLEKIVDLVEGFPVNYSIPYGSYLQDRQGNTVGYWYSSLQMIGVQVDNEKNTVFIRTETPWLWDDLDSHFQDLRRPVMIALSQAPGCQKKDWNNDVAH
jgi:uncharacterized protein YneR